MTQKGRALTPEEIVAALNYLHALDQYFAMYVPTADALSALGRPSLSQRVAQVRQDIGQTIKIYSDMYRSAVEFRSRWDQMNRDTWAQINQGLLQSAQHSQAVFDKWWCIQNYLNKGVPYNEALLLCGGLP
jgi:hypothetical protein